MKALTLHQPWATLIVLGAKRIETRSWATHYRGPIAIHASRRFTREQEALCEKLRFRSALRPILSRYPGRLDPSRPPWRQALPFGRIVGSVELVDCRPTRELRAELNTDDDEWHFGDFTDGPGGIGRYGFMLANPQYIALPIPARGQQGIWDWDQQPYDGSPPEPMECVNP